MRRTKLSFLFKLLLISMSMNAQHSSKPNKLVKDNTDRPVYFSIQVKSDKSMRDSLEIYYWQDYINGLGQSEGALFFKTPVMKNNRYQFKLPGVDRIGRLVLVNNQIGNLMIAQVVEPGDSILMSLQFNDQDNFQATFKGKGASKYNFTQSIKLEKFWMKFEEEKEPMKMSRLVDSLLHIQVAELDRFISKSGKTKTILKFDLVGDARKRLLSRLRYDYRKADIKGKLQFEKVLDELVDPEDNGNEAISLSKHFIEYLYEKEKLKLIYLRGDNETNNGRSFSFKDLYSSLKNGYQGPVREKLLAYCLMQPWDMALFFKGADPDDYTYCLKDAFELIQTPYLKAAVQRELLTRGKGVDAFDFALPDSTGRIVNLHDLKGKVVFVDIWANPCGGCKKFNEFFDKEVYPWIKDNPEIKVVSIALNDKREKWLEGLKYYSHPDFINLYTGGQGSKHPLANHYNIMGIPYFLLIDRNGKIYSTTIPFIERGDDLLALIKRCLSEK